MNLKDLLPTLQVAIGPVILISGIGLLLLSMTNRLGRTVDRSRELARECRHSDGADRARTAEQLTILMQRAAIMRHAIASACVAVLLAAMLIIVVFVGALLPLPLTAPLVGGLFVFCMMSVVASLSCFLRDINLSLSALTVEIEASLRA